MNNNSMFDLEDCGTVKIEDCKTTSNSLIRGRKIEDLTVIRSEAGLSELGKLGIPIEELDEAQINNIVDKILDKDSIQNEDKLETWWNDTANFATLSSNVKCAVIGAILASLKLGYKSIKAKLTK
ncbi:hypothetical protein ACUYOF_12180 [Photobacterium ganghwense]|uniref:hypothetical protein n=1 Tax=Photobacterium ganghwense TaxID=320778 RepID=UPI004056A1CD